MRLTALFSALAYVCVGLCVTNLVYSQPVGSLRVLHVACRGNGQRGNEGLLEGVREREKRLAEQRDREKDRDIYARGNVTVETVQ